MLYTGGNQISMLGFKVGINEKRGAKPCDLNVHLQHKMDWKLKTIYWVAVISNFIKH